jgi:hypothetical protein
MPITGQVTLACLGLLACAAAASAQAAPPLLTRAERTGFTETSRYTDVIAFIQALAARTPRLRVETFGRSEEGRDLPLMVIGDPPAATPQQARASGRPVVFVMANIHAGEVEGKEAVLHLARRLTTGDLQPLAAAAVWLFAPIYNADGNERISADNRSEQYGPVGGVGTRENAKGFDLNRDYMKLDTAEARALVALLARWDPAVVVDLHTTNGSYHGYHLTYAPTLNPNADSRLIAYARERLLPAVRRAMATRHELRTYFYGNFAALESLARDREVPPAAGEGTPVWRTFDQRPRFGNNYVGLRNRIAILSEAYSYLDFKGRVQATEAFVEEVMRYVAANAAEVLALVAEVDGAWSAKAASPRTAAVGFTLQPLLQPLDILVGSVEKKPHPQTGKPMLAMVERDVRPVRMVDYGLFAATTRRPVPARYLVLPYADGMHLEIARKLEQHGIRVEVLTEREKVRVQRFRLGTVTRAERPFQGHREVAVTGEFEDATIEMLAGSITVRTDQPLGPLVFYLLEPESDDGVTTWNMLDTYLFEGAVHPVLKAVP